VHQIWAWLIFHFDYTDALDAQYTTKNRRINILSIINGNQFRN
jgi:hypothetical protein